MKGHFLGQDRNSGEASSAHGSSLAVRQFMDLISGWVSVHRPSTPFRVDEVVVEERYCLKCYAIQSFDVVRGAGRELAFCRCCGKEADSG